MIRAQHDGRKTLRRGHNPLRHRPLINGMITLSGGLILISGLMLLFHYESGLIKGTHELASLILLAFAILHLRVNWPAFRQSLGGATRPLLLILIGAGLAMALSGNFYDNKGLRALLKQCEAHLTDQQKQLWLNTK